MIRPAEERFWSHVDRRGPDECWPWLANALRGYGAFIITHGHTVRAHRFAYELLVGPIPDGLQIDHTCHDPATCPGGPTCPHRACVNPAHMVPSTARDNVLRGNAPTAHHAAKTHCPQGHPYSGPNLRITRNRRRTCRACRADYDRRRTARADR